MDALFVWVARGLLLALIVVFILGFGLVQQRMGKYPGKSAARILWLATMSPWRSHEVEGDFLRQGFPILIWLFSITLLGIGTATYFMAPLLLLGVFQFLLFVVVMLLVFFVSTRISEKGSFVVAALGPTIILIGLLLALGSVFGFSFFVLLLTVNPVFRIAVSVIFLVLLCWQYAVILFISYKALEIRIISSLGRLLIVIGFILLMSGVTIGTLGPEGINSLIQQFAMFPLEFVQHLELTIQSCIFLSNPWNLLLMGSILLVIGVLLWAVDYLSRPRQTEPLDVTEIVD